MTFERLTKAAIAAHLELLAEGRCPSCRELVEGNQVGKCVYCEKCGARMYNGRKSGAKATG